MSGNTNKMVKIILKVLPVICVILSIVAIMGVIISLNPDVKWDEYKDDPYGIQMFAQYSHTLWSNVDPTRFQKTTNSGKYLQVLKDMDNDSDIWKAPIRDDLYAAIGLTSGSLFLLILSLVVHAITKQKLITVILMTTFTIGGCVGGYFMEHARNSFIGGRKLAIASKAASYYHEDKNSLSLGCDMVHYSAIILLVACGINLIDFALFIKFGDGEWVWQRQKQTEVEPIRKMSII